MKQRKNFKVDFESSNFTSCFIACSIYVLNPNYHEDNDNNNNNYPPNNNYYYNYPENNNNDYYYEGNY